MPADGSSATKTIAPRKRVAKGPKRPQYLLDSELDKFMMMLTAVLTEVQVVRDRLETHEALAKQGKPVTAENVEAYKLPLAEQETRDAGRAATLRRVFRIMLEELEEAQLAISLTDLKEVLVDDGVTPDDEGHPVQAKN